MRLRNAPQPKLGLRNRLITRLLPVAVGVGILLAVWVATHQHSTGIAPAAAYDLPVTLTLRPRAAGQNNKVAASAEIVRVQEAWQALEREKAERPGNRSDIGLRRQQLQLLREIEDHEMRVALHATQPGFDPEPYRSKIDLLRTKLNQLTPAVGGMH